MHRKLFGCTHVHSGHFQSLNQKTDHYSFLNVQLNCPSRNFCSTEAGRLWIGVINKQLCSDKIPREGLRSCQVWPLDGSVSLFVLLFCATKE